MSDKKEYQAYIDQLHNQIAELELEQDRLLETISEQANQLDAYETAMINAFVKWGASK